MRLPKLHHWVLFCLFPFAHSFGTFVGNPGQPALQNTGIIRSSTSSWSFRLGYFGDYVYKQQFHDEFKIRGSVASFSDIRLWTQAGMLTFNARERIDLYAILGGSRIEIDQDLFTNQQLSWGFGGKLVIVHAGRFRVGLDAKYLECRLKPNYIVSEGYAYNIVSDFQLNYREIQAALGVSCRWEYISPYINATYLISKTEPQPLIALVRLPTTDFSVDVVSKSVIGWRRWGMAIGSTIIDRRKASLALEWRLFNQNAVSVSGEVRF